MKLSANSSQREERVLLGCTEKELRWHKPVFHLLHFLYQESLILAEVITRNLYLPWTESNPCPPRMAIQRKSSDCKGQLDLRVFTLV